MARESISQSSIDLKVPSEFYEQEHIKEFIRNVKRRVSTKREIGNNDAVIAITGDPGSGKSSLMLFFCRLFAGKDFDLDQNVIYVPRKETVIDRILDGLPYGAPVGLDEAIKALHKHKWNSPAVRFLTELFNICRKRRKIVIFCLPRFQDLPEYFRNDRVMFRIYIIRRGLAALFVRLPTPYGGGGWHWDKVGNKWQKWLGAYTSKGCRPMPEEIIHFFRKKDPTFLGTFEYPILPREFEIEYEKRVDKHKFELADETKTLGYRERKHRESLKNLLHWVYKNKKFKGVTQQDLSKRTNISQGTISEMLREVNKEKETLQKSKT